MRERKKYGAGGTTGTWINLLILCPGVKGAVGVPLSVTGKHGACQARYLFVSSLITIKKTLAKLTSVLGGTHRCSGSTSQDEHKKFVMYNTFYGR